MTKVFCDHCEKEIPFTGFVRFDKITGYYCHSNCLTSNPRIDETDMIYCSKQCAKDGLAKFVAALKPTSI